MRTREEYENLINTSPLFGICKESYPALYKTERYNLLTLITDYYRYYIYPNKDLEEYSVTLMETASECIKYYDKNKGEFLHLFNSAFKRDFHVAKAKEISEQTRQGVKIAGEDDKKIRAIIKFANAKGLDINDEAVQKRVAQALNMSADKVSELIQINDNVRAMSSVATNDEGEEVDLFDLQQSTLGGIEDALEDEDLLRALINQIDSVFVSVQARQKTLLSMRLTAEIIKVLDYDDTVKSLLDDVEFVSREVIDCYCEKGEILSKRQIAEKCGVTEQSASRTYKNFKEKLKKSKINC